LEEKGESEMKRIFTAITMAAAALATLSLAAPSVVSAGTSSPAVTHIGKTYTKGEAGYMMTGGGFRFRYLKTTLAVPAADTRATSARLSLWNDADALYLWAKAGGGPGSIGYGWSWQEEGTALNVAPNVGDKVTLSIYYDHKAHQATITAADPTQGTSATKVIGATTFLWAQVSGGGPQSLASSDTRLWAFKDTSVTSWNGTHGTVFGPWNTYRVIGVQRYSNTVTLWPAYPWNNGHNFGIWWQAAS